MSHKFHLCVLLIAVVCAPSALAQIPPLYWVAPVDIEEGVPIVTSMPVGQVTVGCPLDDYSNSVDWGDNTHSQLETPNSSHPVTPPGKPTVQIVNAGTYQLFTTSAKTFGPAVPGAPAITAVIHSRLHCYSLGGTENWQVSAQIRVWPHLPLDSIFVKQDGRNTSHAANAKVEADTEQMISTHVAIIRGGAPFFLTLVSHDAAPPSDAHAVLTWTSPNGGLDFVLKHPSEMVIQHGLYVANVRVLTSTTHIRRRITVTADTHSPSGVVEATFDLVP